MDVIATDEFSQWYDSLDRMFRDSVTTAVDRLEQVGIDLGHPWSSAINDATFALRELRVKTSGHALRVFYAFDPSRDAVLILGGDKSGDGRFYETMVPTCEQIWRQYLAERQAGLHGQS